MKVYVITNTADPFSAGGESEPLAVVADATGLAEPYAAREFRVIGSPEQETHIRAFNEVSKLSDAAKARGGVTPETLQALEGKADGGLSLNAGDSVWLKLDYKPGRLGGPAATGVYRLAAGELPEDGFWPMKLLDGVADFQAQQQKVAAASELGSLSPSTRACLRMAMKP